MKKRAWLAGAALALILVLSACAPAPAAPPAPSPVGPLAAPVDEPEMTEAERFLERFPDLYLLGETVELAEEHEGGWLVRYTYGGGSTRHYDWVFPSGKLCALGWGVDHKVLGTGFVRLYTDGIDLANGWSEMPEIMDCQAVEGADYANNASQMVYLPLEQSWRFGFSEEVFAASLAGDPEYYRSRPEQLYQARLGLSGLECAFIPDSSDPDNFSGFFTAFSSPPNTMVSFDPDSRELTIHLAYTTLTSPAVEESVEEGLGDLYPCTFPEGSLGEDGPWISNARVRHEGYSTLITLTLSSQVVGWRWTTGHLPVDEIPYFSVEGFPFFRLEFTSNDYYLYPVERLPE